MVLLALVSTVNAEVVIFEDGFEDGNTNGWIVGGADDTAANGTWEFGDPVGTFLEGEPAQPETGFESTSCAFTAQNTVGNPGFHDVDDGIVYLVSPVLDLSGFSSVRLEYMRWYYILGLNGNTGDYFVVQARDSETSAWVELDYLDDSARENSWMFNSVLLEDAIGLTSTVQVRFGASDGPPVGSGTVLEAAVDKVRVIGLDGCKDNTECDQDEYCSGLGECLPFGDGDVDFDGDVDITDYMDCLSCIGAAGGSCGPCNVVGDEFVQVEDLAACSQIMSGPNG
ncbi:MAG: hypothetical protein DHS20C16_18230 [Phycisphaerae bacterium]|nr:MAG: hypothetical protein DHS20C16_18230 [Phycisphaerae bacterium]